MNAYCISTFCASAPIRPINVSVPLHFINEEACVGVKTEGGTLTHNMTEVEITCLPAALPEYIEVDMAEVAAGVSIHLSDLIIPEGVAIAALAFGEDRDIPVASVTARRGSGEDEEISDEPAQPPALPMLTKKAVRVKYPSVLVKTFSNSHKLFSANCCKVCWV